MLAESRGVSTPDCHVALGTVNLCEKPISSVNELFISGDVLPTEGRIRPKLNAQSIRKLLQVSSAPMNTSRITMHIVRAQKQPTSISFMRNEEFWIDLFNRVKQFMLVEALKQLVEVFIRFGVPLAQDLLELTNELRGKLLHQGTGGPRDIEVRYRDAEGQQLGCSNEGAPQQLQLLNEPKQLYARAARTATATYKLHTTATTTTPTPTTTTKTTTNADRRRRRTTTTTTTTFECTLTAEARM